MNKQFGWKSASTFQSNPQDIGERLTALEEEHAGLTTEIIVADAKSPDSVLHGDFEWDDAVAGAKWRKNTASLILRCIVTVKDSEKEGGEPEVMRVFANVTLPGGNRVYTSTARVVADEDMYRQVVGEILKSIQDYRHKLSMFEQYRKIEGAFQELESVLVKEV